MRCYLCTLANLVVFTVWILVWEQYGLLTGGAGGACSCEQQPSIRVASVWSNDSVELAVPGLATRRPLLVRFNWYSRKTTPVHIG